MIKMQNIALRRGARLLFEAASQDIYDGEKIGLVGENGSGKSSLFAMLMGQISIDQGNLALPASMRISHVSQQTPDNEMSALDYVIDGDREFRKVQGDLAMLDGRHDQGSAELYSKMEDMDGYSVPARAAKLLSGLGFKASEQHNQTSSFSGGLRVRLNLAQALMAPSDLLLLDEPTNHLDLDAIVWLEEWLKKYQGTLILISHDREFIDGCCRRIFHIEHNAIRSYSGNYSQFERQRAERLANEHSTYQKQQKKAAHMESYIRRFRYKASKARQAQSRIKALEKLRQGAPAHAGSPFSFRFKPCDRLSDPILKLEDVDAGYGEKNVLNNVNLSIAGGDRIGLLGANGAGKSTLIKIMEGQLAPSSGSRLEARNLKTGYFAQHQLEQLDSGLTPMQQFQRHYPTVSPQQIRRFLAGFDFRQERIDEVIAQFSGGEKARLALALLIYARPNILLLDEPTNHLDMEMRHALNMAIQDYEGAIILVSHDRSLINSVADQLLLIRSGRVEMFNEDMAAYLRILKNSDSKEPAGVQTSECPDGPANGLSKKQRRQLAAQYRQQLKPQRDRVKNLERKMQKYQHDIESLDAALNDPVTWQTQSTSELAGMIQDKASLEQGLESVETGWIDAMEILEALEKQIT